MDVPEIPFAPPLVSVNRVRIVELPGVALDTGVEGALAYNLLSAQAVVCYARERADALHLPSRYRDGDPEAAETRREVPRYVDACLGHPDERVRAVAEAIARRLGRNLGYILLTLHRGDDVNRAARAEWRAAEWEHWAAIRRVWLGGGLLSGDLGLRVIRHAQGLLAELGDGLPEIARTPYPRDIVLLGAARYLPVRDGVAVCCDFGQTGIKRAFVTLDGGRIVAVRALPSLPVVWRWLNAPEAARGIVAEEVRDLFVTTLSRTLQDCRKVERAASPDVMMSVAAYVRDGALLGNGMYNQVMSLTGDSGDVRVFLSNELAARYGEHVRIHVIHDGTAAAAFHAGDKDSVVLVVGTAIGVGFSPGADAGLRQLALPLRYL